MMRMKKLVVFPFAQALMDPQEKIVKWLKSLCLKKENLFKFKIATKKTNLKSLLHFHHARALMGLLVLIAF